MKILEANVGAFITAMAVQMRAGITGANAVGINIQAGDIDMEFTAEIIYDPQSLTEVTVTSAANPQGTKTTTVSPFSEVTTTANTKSTDEAAFNQTTTEAAFNQTTTEAAFSQVTTDATHETPGDETVTRASTTEQASSGGNGETTANTWTDHE